MQAIRFKNFTDKDFTWSFDSIPYTFKAGESMYLEDFKAKHFAKHLVDRELNKLNIPTNMTSKRDELERQCFTEDEPVTSLEALNLNEGKTAEVKKEVEEEEFPDLNPEPKVELKTKTKKTK